MTSAMRAADSSSAAGFTEVKARFWKRWWWWPGPAGRHRPLHDAGRWRLKAPRRREVPIAARGRWRGTWRGRSDGVIIS